MQFTANGGFVRRWGARGTTNGLFSGLVGVAVDAAGSVYVTDEGNHRVQKFTASGTYVSQFGNVAGSGLLGSPSSIAVNGSGNVFVTDAENERIMKYTSNGVFITGFGSRGLGDGQFRDANGVCVYASGNVMSRIVETTESRSSRTPVGSWAPGARAERDPGNFKASGA